MLPSLSRGLRLALILALGAGYLGWQGHGHAVWANAGDDDQEEEGDDDAGKGEEDDGAEDDKGQPPVTAGGLFTMKTYPVNELLRPLTMTQNITQARLGIGTDVSSLGAFSSAGFSLEGQYGVADNFMVIGGFTSAYNVKQFSVYGGFEGSLLYDTIDIRLAANLHRFAVAHLCTDTSTQAGCRDSMNNVLSIPDGNYDAGKTQFSVDIGFPFRYAFQPEIAIIALQTLMSVDFNEASHTVMTGNMTTKVIENGSRPDLNPSVGIATNPIPQLSLVVFGQLRVIDFNTDKGNFQIPVTGRVEFSPNQQLDIGLEFTLLNVKPPDPQKPFDSRFVSLFVQGRIGK